MQNHKRHFILKTLDKLTRILPFLFWGLLILGFDEPYSAILTLISAILHEGAHYIAALHFGGARVRARLHGFGLSPRGRLSYSEELIVVAAGPLANLAAFALLCPFGRESDYLYALAIINLLTAVSNLIPFAGNDGYRIALAVFSWLGVRGAEAVLNRLSAILCFIACIFSLYAVSRLNAGYFATVTLLFLLCRSLSVSSPDILREKERK